MCRKRLAHKLIMQTDDVCVDKQLHFDGKDHLPEAIVLPKNDCVPFRTERVGTDMFADYIQRDMSGKFGAPTS